MLASYLAMRYLRRRRAAWLAFGAVTLTVTVPVVVLGIMQGWTEITHAQIRSAEPDLTVLPRTYRQTVAEEARLGDWLLDKPNVAHITPFIETTAALVPHASATSIIGVQVDGVDWAKERENGRLPEHSLHKPPVLDLSEPDIPAEQRGSGCLTRDARAHLVLSANEWLAPLSGMPIPAPPKLRPFKPGIVVGRELAMLNPVYLGLGNKVKLVIPDGTGGTIGRLTCEVSDTIGTGVYKIDRYTAILGIPEAQYLTMMNGRHPDSGGLKEISGYRVTLADPEDWKPTQEAIMEDKFLYVPHWTQLHSDMVGSLLAYERIIIIVMSFVQLLCVFIVYAVFSTLVAEKRHDIGVLKGLGASSNSMVATFLIAGAVVCLTGGILGWGIGWLFLWAGIPLIEDVMGFQLFPQEVIYTPDTPISFNPFYPLMCLVFMTFIGFLAAYLPARRAGRIEPVDTIREAG